MEIVMLDPTEDDVIARGTQYGGPDYEFVVAPDGHVDWRAVGDTNVVWAGPDADSFRRIVAVWNRYRTEYRPVMSAAERREYFSRMQRELASLGALPSNLPPEPEPLWSLLLFEAENDLG